MSKGISFLYCISTEKKTISLFQHYYYNNNWKKTRYKTISDVIRILAKEKYPTRKLPALYTPFYFQVSQ